MTGLLKLTEQNSHKVMTNTIFSECAEIYLRHRISSKIENSPISKKSCLLIWGAVISSRMKPSCAPRPGELHSTLQFSQFRLWQSGTGRCSLSLTGRAPASLLLASRPGPAGSSAQLSTSKPCQHWLVKTVPALHPFSSAFVREIIQDLHSFLETFVWWGDSGMIGQIETVVMKVLWGC